MKVLIIRFSSIGDIVLTTPVIRCLKNQIPGVEIHFLTKKSYRSILQSNPHLSKIHWLDDNMSNVISELRKEKFNFIIDLHNNFRSTQVKYSLRTWGNTVNKVSLEKWLYVRFRINAMPIAHIVDRYMDTVRDLKVYNDGKGLDYFIPVEEKILLENLPLSHLHGYVVFAIGAQHETKKLPVGKWKELVNLLHFPVIIVGGQEDEERGNEIASIDAIKVFNACGKFSINQSASVIRQSKAVITHDTGMMHIAAAFKKKIISVWGNTIPEFGMYPYFANVYADDLRYPAVMNEVKNLSCRPCSKLGYDKCPRGHFKCMNLQMMNAIAAALQNN